MSPKTYILVCHGCGAFHELETAFLSSPLAISFDVPGEPRRSWCVPMRACPTCHAIVTERREDHPIARAFAHGMTPEARARANREYSETWLARLEARKDHR